MLQFPFPVPPKVPIEKVDKYRWAYVILVFSVLLSFFVGAYMLATQEITKRCEEEMGRIRIELSEYKRENRELLAANYLKLKLLYSIDSLARTKIDEMDVKQTVESAKNKRVKH